MSEVFKVCVENYEISNFGNVRIKLKNSEYKTLKCSILKSGGGYKYFQLKRNGKRKNFLVHHLVAEHFIGARPKNLVIDHIDRNPQNNNLSNLRYVSQKENTHNTKNYINEIKEDDPKKRKCLLGKRYNKAKKDQIESKKKQPFKCECGSTVRTDGKICHLRSKKHIEIMKKNQKSVQNSGETR